jgi:hypothetical protein
LFVATLLSGGGWVTMSAAAINAIVTPWFVRTRPQLSPPPITDRVSAAWCSPLWVAAIGLLGFPLAAAIIGLVVIVAI